MRSTEHWPEVRSIEEVPPGGARTLVLESGALSTEHWPPGGARTLGLITCLKDARSAIQYWLRFG